MTQVFVGASVCMTIGLFAAGWALASDENTEKVIAAIDWLRQRF